MDAFPGLFPERGASEERMLLAREENALVPNERGYFRALVCRFFLVQVDDANIC